MSYFAAGLGAALGRHTIAHPGVPAGAQTFAQWLASTNSGAGPAHYWSMSDVPGATMTAETGGLNGTYVSPLDLEFEITDAAAVKHVGFSATNGYATILTPVTTAAFTLMWRLQTDTAPTRMTLATTGFAATPGQFLIQLEDDGAGGHKPRVGSKDAAGASVIYVGTNTDSCPVGTVFYFFYIRASNGTQEVWVVDVAAGTALQIPLTLDVGTPPGSWSVPPAGNVFFFTTTAVSDSFDGVACRMALWDSAIPRTDITALADIAPADEPIVVWARALDAGEVNESTALSDISILGNIHPATGFTAAVIDGTGTRGTLTTDGTDLTYTAGAVTGNQTDTAMSWRISAGSPPVNSPTVGFSIDVLEAGAPPPASANANCFDETGATLVTVSTMADLQTQVNNATGKKVVRIANGTYSGGSLTFSRAAGSSTKVIIRPLNNLGDVTINGGSWTFSPSSSHIVISKLHTSGQIILQGTNNRITRCRWRNFGEAIRCETGGNVDCRIDHCDFADPGSGDGSAISLRSADVFFTISRRLLIDYCYFHAPWNLGFHINNFGLTSNARANDIARGQSIIVDHCLFEDFDGLNGSGGNIAEFVINKTGGMIYRFCTFDNIDGYFQWRAGNNCELRSCWFEGISRAMLWADDTLTIGNRFIGSVPCWIPCGNSTADQILSGAAPFNSYPCSRNGDFIGNRFGSGNFLVGQFHAGCTAGGQAADEEVVNALLEANTRDSGGAAHVFVTTCLSPSHTGTSVSGTTSASFVPAVKLTSGSVGLLAADPLCA